MELKLQHLRFLQLLLVVVVVGLIAACSGNGEGSTTELSDNASKPAEQTGGAEPKEAEEQPKEQPEEPVELTIAMNIVTPKEDSYAKKYVEEKLNVKLNLINMDPASYAEQLNIRLASGEIPDLFFLPTLAQYADQGVLREITQEEIRREMPKYAESIDQLNEMIWLRPIVKGKGYSIPQYWAPGTYPFAGAFNATWLKNVGYDSPPATIDEMEDVLRKLRNDDPDGNGQKDTYGMSPAMQGSDTQAFSTIFGGFDTYPYYWLEQPDGTLAKGIVTSNVRDALKVLHKWYKEDLIDPEFLTQDHAMAMDKFVTGKVGYNEHNIINSWGVPEWEGTPANLLKQNTGNDLAVAPPLSGPYGPGANYAFGGYGTNIGMGAHLENDPVKVAKIYEILRAVTEDPEFFIAVMYGIEGETYEEKDGALVSTLDPNVAAQDYGLGGYFTFYMQIQTFLNQYAYNDHLEAAMLKNLTGNDGKPLPKKLNQIIVSLPSAAEYPDMGAFEREKVFAFITGGLDPNNDTVWEQFVQDWNSRGGDVLTKEANDIFAANR